MSKPSDIKPLLSGRDDYSWNDELPDRLAEIIQEGWRKKKAKPPTDNIHWKRLGRIVSTYLDELEYQRGFLNKGQADQLKKIAKRAGKLRDDIDQLRELGADWYLVSELRDAGIDEAVLSDALKSLSIASELKPRSPKLEEDADAQRGWLKDHLRADLQIELDKWWKHNSGLPKITVSNAQDTPYAKFLKELFLPIKRHNVPGYSERAVKAARQSTRKRKLEYDERMRKIAQEFAKFQEGTRSD